MRTATATTLLTATAFSTATAFITAIVHNTVTKTALSAAMVTDVAKGTNHRTAFQRTTACNVFPKKFASDGEFLKYRIEDKSGHPTLLAPAQAPDRVLRTVTRRLRRFPESS